MPKGKKDDKPIAEEKFQQFDVNAKDPKTVVLMLDSPEIGVLCKACQSLQQYMEKSEQNCSEIHNLGVVPKLIKLLNSQDKVVYGCAVVTLGVMIPNLSVRRSLLKLECIPPLFKLLKADEELYSIERAVFIIANLSEEYTFKNRIVEENGCQLLLPLLSHTDCDILKHSLNALSLLTIHNTAKSTIANENGFPALLALLDSEYAEIQESVLHTLEHCLHDAQCRESFSSSDGLSKITDFLNKQEWNDLHVLAIDVLSLCLVNDNGLEALHSSNCLQKLLQSMTDSQIPQMMTKAAKALASASRDTTSKKILHEQNAEKSFIELLSSQDDDVCVAASEALRGMSTLTTSRQYIGQEGGIKALVTLLQHPNITVRSSAVQTLSSVTFESIANCNLVNDACGMEILANLLTDDSANSRSSAAQCIISMSSSASLRSILVQNNVMEHLAGCLSHTDEQVLSNACRAIALLAVDSTAREKFPVGSISVLLDLILSNSTQVCSDSVWAIAVLAQSKAITDAVFTTKGVQTIERLSEESSHKRVREYGKIAFNRLLSGSPSAKFNLTKVLSPQDILVNNEFWDLGLGEGTGFVPLEELVNQTATINRPVISVSLLNKPLPPQPIAIDNEEESKVKDETETASSSRSKSRQTQHNTKDTGKSKKTKDKPSTERQISPEDDNASGSDTQSHQGLLEPDSELWEHITNVLTTMQGLNSVKSQVETLAVYVSQVMGGPIKPDQPVQYELPLAEVQGISSCPLVPLGKIKKGTFQHRALLFKVLSDQLGIPCSLHRGQYSRHWNTVILDQNEMLVDLVYTPSKLSPINSSDALQYQSV